MEQLKEIGKIFEKTRNEKGLTVEAVSKRTRIHPKVLKGLEEGTLDPKMSRIYVKSFVKEYSNFLGLDPKEVLKKYGDTVQRPDEQRLHIEPKDATRINFIMEWVTLVAAIALLVLIVAGLTLGFMKFRDFFQKKKGKPAAAQVSRTASRTKAQAAKTAAAPAKVSGVALTVRTLDKVWIYVEKDGNMVYSGVVDKGSVESWQADKGFVLRVGKLEAIEFTLNNKNLGKIGSGVKRLVVDKNGIKIAEK